jgi:IS66 C-terminal element
VPAAPRFIQEPVLLRFGVSRDESEDPQAWLADVLVRINDHAVHKLDELLPWNWRKPMPGRAKAA